MNNHWHREQPCWVPTAVPRTHERGGRSKECRQASSVTLQVAAQGKRMGVTDRNARTVYTRSQGSLRSVKIQLINRMQRNVASLLPRTLKPKQVESLHQPTGARSCCVCLHHVLKTGTSMCERHALAHSCCCASEGASEWRNAQPCDR